jgi:hypothetical protein
MASSMVSNQSDDISCSSLDSLVFMPHKTIVNNNVQNRGMYVHARYRKVQTSISLRFGYRTKTSLNISRRDFWTGGVEERMLIREMML